MNGVNEAHIYQTKVVEVKLKLGRDYFKIRAIALPEIKTDINLPGLTDCAIAFINKGYELADAELVSSNVIRDLDLILGTENPELLTEEQVTFGGKFKSVFSNTRAGIILYGNVNVLRDNLKFLPDLSSPTIPNAVQSFLSGVCNDTSNSPNMVNCDAYPLEVNINSLHVVLNEGGEIDEDELNRASENILNQSLNYENVSFKEDTTEVDDKVVDYILSNISRSEDGRLCMPLPWKGEIVHLLGLNYNLSEKILLSNLRKLKIALKNFK